MSHRYGSRAQQNHNYLTMAEMAPSGTREGWYSNGSGSAYELNNTSLSGSGPHWGPKLAMSAAKGRKIGIAVLVGLAIILLILATCSGGAAKPAGSYYF